MTTQQEENLNRAIAEFEGYQVVSSAQFHYTYSLDAIVPVVQRWCEKDKYNCLLLASSWGYATVGLFITSKQPALSLCIEFAKAAGLKGDWDDHSRM